MAKVFATFASKVGIGLHQKKIVTVRHGPPVHGMSP